MRIRAGLWTAVVALVLTSVPLVAASAQAATPTALEPDSPSTAREQAAPAGGTAQERLDDPTARADRALETARDLFTGRPTARLTARAHGGPTSASETHGAEHASAVLRELSISLPHLSRRERRQARAILGRPTDGRDDAWGPAKYEGADADVTCSDVADVCLHWVTAPGHRHAPVAGDDDGDGVPDAVEEYRGVLEHVWQRVILELGYREPRSDLAAADHGPDGRTDIYLAELGAYGMYGYCTMEGSRRSADYCVLDNDFIGFPGSPADSLRVTAAHEFFHAVQFAYSTRADLWLMEGTAAWVEDEVYDGINDNLQYLTRSALWLPGSSLDRVAPPQAADDPLGFNWRYGSWIWWRFLTEYFGEGRGRDLEVVREVWQRVATDGQGLGALQAQRRALAARRASFGAVFARFGAANRMAPRWYAEGRAYARFVAPADGRFTLQKSRRSTGWRATRLDHLSTRHAVIRPGRNLRGAWRLRIDVDLPRRVRGPRATAAVQLRNGRVRWHDVRLDRRGAGRITVPFNRRRVRHVTLSLTNASTRMKKCGQQALTSPFSCGGVGVDDDLVYTFRARTARPR